MTSYEEAPFQARIFAAANMWCYAVDDRPSDGPRSPCCGLHLHRLAKGEPPATHLAGFSGLLQVDGSAGFKRLAGNRQTAR